MPKIVLLVDDDPSVIDLLVNILNLLGVQTQVAHNGRVALDAIKANPPDAVILDLMMPVMDGFTMLSQLRREEVGQKMPVIVLSALADQKGMMERLPGIIGTITKGRFSLLDLRDMLGKAGIPLDGAPTLAPPPPAASQPAPAQPPAAAPQPASAAAPTQAAPPTPPTQAPPAQIQPAPSVPTAPAAPPMPVPPQPAPAIRPLPEDTIATPPLGIPRPANGHANGNGSKPTS